MFRTMAFVIAFAVVIASGVSHALLTDRYHSFEDLNIACERLKGADLNVSGWEAHEGEMTPEETERAGIAGYRKIRFINKATRTEVQFLIVCGKGGPISVHTPDVCYLGVGFSQVDSRKGTIASPEGTEAEFVAGLFQKDGIIFQRVFWLFTADGNWKAPDSPRGSYGRERALYKIYVVRQLLKPDEPMETDPALEVLSELMPQLQKKLFTPTT